MRRSIFVILLLVAGALKSDAAGTFGAFCCNGGSGSSTPVANSLVTPQFIGAGGENPTVNVFKGAAGWTYVDGSGHPAVGELDNNGYPLYGSTGMVSHGGDYSPTIPVPSQAERPGHYVARGIGSGEVSLYDTSGTNAGVLCTGSMGGFGNAQCTTSGCSSFTGSITGYYLTVTIAPTGTGCGLVVGQPISGGSILVGLFGTPTIITGESGSSNCPSCTGTGGVGTYLLNYSQSVGSGSINPGWRFEMSVTGEGSTTVVAWAFSIIATTSGNTIKDVEIVHVNDEEISWTAPLALGSSTGLGGVLWKQRIAQANFKIIRDLNWGNANNSNCTIWANRTPSAFYSWSAEQEPSGLTASAITYASSTDTYSVTFGSGNFADKETIVFVWPVSGVSFTGASSGSTALTSSGVTGTINVGAQITGTGIPASTYIISGSGSSWVTNNATTVSGTVTVVGGTLTSKISLNSNASVPISNSFGQAITNGGQPAGNINDIIVYDAILGSAMHFSGGSDKGLSCAVPPEAELQLAYETDTNLWVVALSLAVDPMTDYYPSFYSLAKSTFPSMTFIQETPDEMDFTLTQSSCYMSSKSNAYKALDSHWTNGLFYCGPGGNNLAEEGKVASTLGQALVASGLSKYELVAGVQTSAGTSSYDLANYYNLMMSSYAYVNQNPSNIPTQSGYTQAPAYNYVTRLAVDNYWVAGEAYSLQETADAWCFYYDVANPSLASTAGCASQSTLMSAYTATALSSTSSQVTIYERIQTYIGWSGFGATCGQASRPGGCPMNASPLFGYEGTYSFNAQATDKTAPVTAATNASSAVLSVAGVNSGGTQSENGCVVGQTVGLTSVVGGTWASSYSNLTVTATTNSTCTVNINSTGLGTLTSATLTFTGSGGASGCNASTTCYVAGYTNFLRTQAYLAPSLKTLTTYFYGQFAANGGQYPALFTLAASYFPWFGWFPDIYGYFTEGNCSSCTISTNTMTLGGTVTGVFKVGDTIFGKGVTGPGTGAGSQTTITLIASGTGTQPGDTLTLSQNSTVASGVPMSSNVTPATSPNTLYTNSPVTQWSAICDWNGVGANCGGYLLNRDLDPGSNDNTPVGLAVAA